MHTTTDTVTGASTTTDIDTQTHLRAFECGDVHVGGLRHFPAGIHGLLHRGDQLVTGFHHSIALAIALAMMR